MELERKCDIQCGLKVGAAVALPFLGAGISGYAFRKSSAKEDEKWLESLKKPECSRFAFSGCPWTIAYGTMGAASYFAWRDSGGFSGNARTALALYGTTLVLQWAWAPLFFGKRDLKLSLIDCVLQTGTAYATAVLFYRINNNAGYLMVPMCALLTFCSGLSYCYYKDNKDANQPKK